MTLLGPLWAWLFITLPLAGVAAGLWWAVLTMPPLGPLPSEEYARRLRQLHPPKALDYYREPLSVMAATASSSVGFVTLR